MFNWMLSDIMEKWAEDWDVRMLITSAVFVIGFISAAVADLALGFGVGGPITLWISATIFAFIFPSVRQLHPAMHLNTENGKDARRAYSGLSRADRKTLPDNTRKMITKADRMHDHDTLDAVIDTCAKLEELRKLKGLDTLSNFRRDVEATHSALEIDVNTHKELA